MEESPELAINISDDQCGYCLESGTRRADPRQLPCGHSFCLVCLKNDYERIKAVRCPVCRKSIIIENQLEDLPSALAPVDCDSVLCSACLGFNAEKPKPAVQQCRVQCKMKYCEEHLKHHDLAHFNHETTPVGEEEITLDTTLRGCVQHKRYPVVVGCGECGGLYCHVCLLNESGERRCTKIGDHTSGNHTFDVIENLAKKAKFQVQDNLNKLQTKKDNIQHLVRELNCMSAQLTVKQHETLEQLQSARNLQISMVKQQIGNINKKYDKAEESCKARTAEIQQKTEKYTNQMTELQSQLDDYMSEGRQLLDVTDDMVMVQSNNQLEKAAAMASSDIPPLDVPLALKGRDEGRDLALTPLNYMFPELATRMRISVFRNQPPTAIKFSHRVVKTGAMNKLSVIVGFKDSQDILYYMLPEVYCAANHDLYRLSTKIPWEKTTHSCDRYCLYGKVHMMQLGYNQDVVFRCFDNSVAPITMDNIGEAKQTNATTTLRRESLPGSLLNSFAVVGNDAVALCDDKYANPQLHVWDPSSQAIQSQKIAFKKPTKVLYISTVKKNLRSVLVFCEDAQSYYDSSTWYAKEHNSPVARKALCLVNVDSGAIEWGRKRQDLFHQQVIHDGDYFYMINPYTDNICLEVIDCRSGVTVGLLAFPKELKLGDNPPQSCHIVQMVDGTKRLMVWYKGKMAVCDFAY